MTPGAATPKHVRLNEGLAPTIATRFCRWRPERTSPETGESESRLKTLEPRAEIRANSARSETKTPAARSAPKNCPSEPAAEPLAAGRAAQAEAATNEAGVRRATEANRSSSAKMHWSATEIRAETSKTPAINKPKLPEVKNWPAGRRRTDGPSRCVSELVFGQKPTPKRIKVEADKKEFGEGLTFELTGLRQSDEAGRE